VKYVGANAYSGYRPSITPSIFTRSPELQRKARIFLRRELQVFPFLSPNHTSFGIGDRRATNTEFLLEYIIAVLKVWDMKSHNEGQNMDLDQTEPGGGTGVGNGNGDGVGTGRAVQLVGDYLGRDVTRRLFRELEMWLRSPFQKLGEWDGSVQYGIECEGEKVAEDMREGRERERERSRER
jgi:hypothetical protein